MISSGSTTGSYARSKERVNQTKTSGSKRENFCCLYFAQRKGNAALPSAAAACIESRRLAQASARVPGEAAEFLAPAHCDAEVDRLNRFRNAAPVAGSGLLERECLL